MQGGMPLDVGALLGGDGQVNPMDMLAGNADGMDIISQMFDAPEFRELLEQIRDSEVRAEEERKRKFALLPQDLQDAINSSREQYQSAALLVNVGNALDALVNSIVQDFQGLSSSQEKFPQHQELMLSELKKLKVSFTSGEFSRLASVDETSPLYVSIADPDKALEQLKDLNPQQDKKVQQTEPYTQADLNCCQELINVFSQQYKDSITSSLAEKMKLLFDIIQDVKEKKIEEFIIKALLFVDPRIEDAKNALLNTQSLFEKYISGENSLTFDQEDEASDVMQQIAIRKETIKAIKEWYETVKGYARTIKIFSGIKKTASSDGKKFSDLVKMLSYGYNYVWKMVFYDKYKYEKLLLQSEVDDEKGILKTIWDSISTNAFMKADAIDLAWRSGISAWYFFDMKNDNRKGSFFRIATGRDPVEKLSSLDFVMQDAMGAFYIIPRFFNPCFSYPQLNKLQGAWADVLATYVYYQVFHMNLFNCDLFNVFSDKETELLGGRKEFKGFYDTILSHWPAKYHYFKNALKYATTQTARRFASTLTYKLSDCVNPETLESLNDYSWGIIRPEMLYYIIDASIPAFYSSEYFPKWFAEFDKEDAYGRARLYKVVRSQFDLSGLQGKEELIMYATMSRMTDLVRDGRNISSTTLKDTLNDTLKKAGEENSNFGDRVLRRYKSANSFSVDGYYIEQKILEYVFSSIGKYWGRKLSKRYASQLSSGAYKTGLFFVRTLTAFGLLSQDSIDEFNQMKNMLPMLLNPQAALTGDSSVSTQDSIFSQLKELARDVVLNPSSKFRPHIVYQLKQQGVLDDYEKREEVISQRIIEFAVKELFKRDILLPSEAAHIMSRMRMGVDEGLIVDHIIDTIHTNMVAVVGGFAGEKAMQLTADWISWKYGPFYPKVKNYFMATS